MKPEHATGTVEGQASHFVQHAESRVSEGKEKAASTIDRASEQIRSQFGDHGGPAAPVGEKLAGTLDKTATYLHEHETSEIVDDFEAHVRKHPVLAVAAAAFGGFVLARILP